MLKIAENLYSASRFSLSPFCVWQMCTKVRIFSTHITPMSQTQEEHLALIISFAGRESLYLLSSARPSHNILCRVSSEMWLYICVLKTCLSTYPLRKAFPTKQNKKNSMVADIVHREMIGGKPCFYSTGRLRLKVAI